MVDLKELMKAVKLVDLLVVMKDQCLVQRMVVLMVESKALESAAMSAE